MNSDVARLIRWIVLPFAYLTTFGSLVLLPMVPTARAERQGAIAFWIAGISTSTALLLLAAWLRRQEALDPSNEEISKSLLLHFGKYAGIALLLSLVGRAFIT